MIRINLLPYAKEREKEGGKNQVVIFVLVVAVLIAGLYWYHSRLNNQIADLNDKIEYTQKELERYKKIVAEVEALRAKLEFLRQKLDVIDELKASRGESFRLLVMMTELLVEEKMWLTYLEAEDRRTVTKTGKGKNATEEVKIDVVIGLKGIALDNKTVAYFMSRIEEARAEDGRNLFEQIRLVTLEQEIFQQNKEAEEINLKRFEITFLKAPPAPPEGEATAGKDTKAKPS